MIRRTLSRQVLGTTADRIHLDTVDQAERTPRLLREDGATWTASLKAALNE